ncbi:MAG: thioredoxin domain-containing protein [Bacteroidota bacterium]
MMRNSLPYLLLFVCLLGCKPPSDTHRLAHKEMNHLAGQSSPYLLQHAYNPVDWHPWGPEALEKARKENKMMIISIGYAACHWCHVMEHESFEDSLVSQIMNEHFVSIKIDREERPDIDNVYMTACQLSTEKGCGWPLNAFALPDGRPVWAGTYFPRKNWIEILEYFKKEFTESPDKMNEYADQLTEGVQNYGKVKAGSFQQALGKDGLTSIGDNFLASLDLKKGGRKGAPKFPMPVNYQFLLAYHKYSGNDKVLDAVRTTLDQMAYGGIYDHLGGGFARYSTDDVWKVPHFEKMLYDNGQLVSLYSTAYRLTKNPLYQKVVEESLAFIGREMTDASGGFYSSLDADSEGEEGKFYVWKASDIEALLPDTQERKLYFDYYQIKEKGNWEHGKNILHRRSDTKELAQKHPFTVEQIDSLVAAVNQRLLAMRAERVRPGLDDKILTSWNALMLKGYLDAYRSFGKEEYLDVALKNAQFLLDNALQEDNRLNRNYKDGKSVINAFLDDYALLADAFVALYESTFDEQWLHRADGLVQYAQAHFRDSSSSLFFYTSDLDPPLVARKMENSDNVIPASNSVMARVLLKLGTLLYKTAYTQQARQMLEQLQANQPMATQASFYANWSHLYLELLRPPYEVAILGPDALAKSRQLMTHYLPEAYFLGGTQEGTLELLRDKLQADQTLIYVCQNKVCRFPTEDVSKALSLIDGKK